ncbi:MAG: DUF1311 domain-containing protein [Gammaproteobacteria bacterium]|nr:MAG: DUF1311 domain-containing protein [Gammaproteobacteria bacterium]
MPLMKFKLICLSFIYLLSINYAAAESNSQQDCANAVTTIDLHNCVADEYQRVDAELNATYAKLLKSLDPIAQQKLKIAERRWIKHRDKECLASAEDEEGGSLYPIVLDSCYIDAAEKRIKELKSQ